MTVFLLCIYGWSNNCENNNIRLKFSKILKKVRLLKYFDCFK